MKLQVRYNDLNTTVVFDICKSSHPRGYTLDVLHPVTHHCEKHHKTLRDVAEHLRLSNPQTQVFLMAFKANETSNQVDIVVSLEMIVSAKDIECFDC